MIETALSMPLWTYASFTLAALVLYLTPGPDMMFTLASGAAGGPRAGVAAAAGISLGVLCHCVMAAAGLAAVVAANPALLDVIRYAGAAYLMWVAIQTWRDTDPPGARSGRAALWPAFRRGFVTNILNPKVGLFVLAFLPQFTDPALGPIWQQILILGVVLVLGGFLTDGCYGIFAGAVATRLRRRAKLMNRACACVFGGLAVRLAL